MTNYFEAINAKCALRSNCNFTADGSRADLLLDQYKLSRTRRLTAERVHEIDELYMKWCDQLFSGFNVVVTGPQSKFSLLETFKRRYLDSDRIPDFAAHLAGKKGAMLDIVTVRLHGLDPIKLETFSHTLLADTPGVKASQRPKDADLQLFIGHLAKSNEHYVFLIHSFEYFQRDCEDVCELIFHLYSMDPNRIHLLLSSDLLNAGKRLDTLKTRLNLAFSVAPFSESFVWEKTQLMNELDPVGAEAGVAAKGADATLHRLFSDKVDLQMLKDVYQALDKTTAWILRFIMTDFVEKCALNAQGDEQEEEIMPASADGDEAEDNLVSQQNRMQPKRQAKARAVKSMGGAERRPKVPKRRKVETDLEFHHLLNQCEANFVVRRGAALRDHLGELKDHKIISEDQAGSRIKCLIGAELCNKFLASTE